MIKEITEHRLAAPVAGTMGDGLLGMRFLGGLKYTIDFQKQTLNRLP